mgnify:CR=1 FL=1
MCLRNIEAFFLRQGTFDLRELSARKPTSREANFELAGVLGCQNRQAINRSLDANTDAISPPLPRTAPVVAPARRRRR